MRVSLLPLAFLAGAISACGGHHLADYDFRDRTLAVVALPAPAPQSYTGSHDIDTENPAIAVIEASSAVVMALESHRARARLDSAAANVDFERSIANQAGRRASRYLGLTVIEDESAADFVLEIDVHHFGLNASDGPVTLYVQGEAVLLDGSSGREIWRSDLRASDRITPSVTTTGGSVEVAGDILTAAALRYITVSDFERALQHLADYAADMTTEELREDLRDARDDD